MIKKSQHMKQSGKNQNEEESHFLRAKLRPWFFIITSQTLPNGELRPWLIKVTSQTPPRGELRPWFIRISSQTLLRGELRSWKWITRSSYLSDFSLIITTLWRTNENSFPFIDNSYKSYLISIITLK